MTAALQPQSGILFIAFGSRGDTQPLLVLAHSVSTDPTFTSCRVSFITHAAHMDWIGNLDLSPDLQYFWANSDPFVLPHKRAEQDASQRQCCLSACQTLFAKVPAAARIGLRVCKQPGLIVYNLFSLEGFHLAEAFGLISVAASPCAPPSSAPPGFWDAMAAEDPEFVSSLQASRLPFMRRGGCGDLVSRAHIHEWMWPLFADHWGVWRTAALNLPASPCQFDRTAAPMLLLGISSLLCPESSRSLTTATMCGPWDIHSIQLHRGPEGWLHGPPSSPGSKPLLVDLGCSSRMLDLDQQQAFLELVGALARQSTIGIHLLGSQLRLPELDTRVLEGGSLTQDGREGSHQKVHLHRDPVLHSHLLPSCCAILHVGGAGTTLAAAKAGTPQLVAPLHFDQEDWACCVARTGIGIRIASLLDMVHRGTDQGRLDDEAEALAHAIQRLVRDPGVAQRCREMEQTLRGEDGVRAALRVIERLLAEGSRVADG